MHRHVRAAGGDVRVQRESARAGGGGGGGGQFSRHVMGVALRTGCNSGAGYIHIYGPLPI